MLSLGCKGGALKQLLKKYYLCNLFFLDKKAVLWGLNCFQEEFPRKVRTVRGARRLPCKGKRVPMFPRAEVAGSLCEINTIQT